VRYFFDLPVYRISYDQYYKRRDALLARTRNQIRALAGSVYEPTESMLQRYEDQFYDNYGPWEFNEIIAYIRLHFLGSQVRGEFFSAEKKRNLLSRHKVFTFQTWKLAPEVEINGRDPTSEQILDAVREYIRDCKAELKRDRVIDDSIFEQLAPHLDWQALLRAARP
jgi:hypothetical protein